MRNREDDSTDHAAAHGLVVANHGLHAVVRDDTGRLWQCTRRRSVAPVIAGDHVAWQPLPDGSGVIVECAPRRSLFARPDQRGAAKPIAANIDRLVIVASVVPSFDERLLDRYLVAATLSGIEPLVVINKMDLLDEQGRAAIETRLAPYRALGYEVLMTSVKLQNGLDGLALCLAGRSSVLVGKSGVGKSSLIRSLVPDIEIRVADVSRTTHHGKHTTTAAMLYDLPHGGNIVDSPGIRDFALGAIDAAAAARGYIEIAALANQCRFNDCHHRAEHDCAIKAAVDAGRIRRSRYDSYLALLNECI